MKTTPRNPSPDELSEVGWHISTYSDNGGMSCVEAGLVSDGSGRVAVRHSHHRDGPVLVSVRTSWRSFTTAVRNDAIHP